MSLFQKLLRLEMLSKKTGTLLYQISSDFNNSPETEKLKDELNNLENEIDKIRRDIIKEFDDLKDQI